MKLPKKLILSIVITFFLSSLFVIIKTTYLKSSPAFYLATDKSFSPDEVPYVNLEGMGNEEYNFRIYKVNNPVEFLKKLVKDRHVTETNDAVYGNPFALFFDTIQLLKADFRKVARTEFNYKTRSHIKSALSVDFNAPHQDMQLAIPGLLKNHNFLLSFKIPKGKDSWSYRRVPLPIQDNGLFLIEGVSGSNLAYTLVVKSTINFITKQSENQTVLFAARKTTGEPIDKASFNIIDNQTGATAFTGTTNNSGIGNYTGASFTKSLIIVYKDNEYAISDPNFYSKSFYGLGGVRAYIYTERPIYKPGHQVFFKGIVRSFRDNSYSLASGAATAEVIDGMGKTVISNIPVVISASNGTFSGDFTLPNTKNMYLGVYNLSLNYQNKSYATEFSVEAYKKPPFLVTIKTAKSSYTGSDSIPLTITAKYYFGNPVANEKANVKIFRKKKFDYSPVGALPFFSQASEYLGMSDANVPKELVDDRTVTLDSNGSNEFSIDPKNIDTDYTYIAIATVTSSDATLSGSTAFSVNRSSIFMKITKEKMIYDPGDTASLQIALQAFDKTKSPLEMKKHISGRTIKAILYSRSFTNISSEGDRKKIDSFSVTSNDKGIALLSFKIPESGHYLILCETKDINGKKTASQTSLWASRKGDSIQIPFKNITLKPAKDLFSSGENADILIMTPGSGGTLFITLEGNQIFKHEVVKLTGNSYKYQVKITPELSPNFTFSVTQFSGNDVYQNQVKIVAPPIEKFINVNISHKKEYKPGEYVDLTINTRDYKNRGVASEVSIAVVDEAIYQLQEDKNPHITTYFYHPRRNNVNTTLSTAYRFFGYSESKRLDLALRSKRISPLAAIKDFGDNRDRFKDTCYWSAHVNTNANGVATVRFKLADNLTTWRISAIAVSSDTKVGQGKSTFLARKNLSVLGGIPRYLVKGEQHLVSANVTNLTQKPIKAQVSINVKDAEIVGNKSYSVQLEPRKIQQIYFTIKTAKDTSAKNCLVQLMAQSGSLADAATHTIPTRHFGMYRTIANSVRVTGKENITITIPEKFAEPHLEMRVSPGSGEALRQSLQYLVDYPYGCIEQTMSKFMPLLAAKKAGFISARISQLLPNMVTTGLAHIKGLQQNDGGFGWYGDGNSDYLMTAYVYRGLALCNKLYGKVDEQLMQKAKQYLYKAIDSGVVLDFNKAYILFSLSEHAKIENSMLEAIIKTFNNQTTYGKALIALTCNNNGAKDKAIGLFNQALASNPYLTKKDIKIVAYQNEWSNDDIETMAALLTAAVRLAIDENSANTIASSIVLNRNGLAWRNSRDTAMAVIALSEHLQKYREKLGDFQVSVFVNGINEYAFTVQSGYFNEQDLVKTISSTNLKKGNNVLQVVLDVGEPVYITPILTFFDKSDSFKQESHGLSISRSYYKMATSQGSSGLSLNQSKESNFKVGDLVMVEMKVNKQGKDDSYYIIEDPVSPGFSVINKDNDYYSSDRLKEYTMKQVYEERTVFFVPGPKSGFTIRYFLRASVPGNYKILPTSCALMYYPDLYGNSTEDTVTIAK